jgi:hypothetical protein
LAAGRRPRVNLRLVGERQINALLYPEANAIQTERPRTRADCINAVRPCPWVGCRHHLYLDVHAKTGAITLNFPAKEPEDGGASARPSDRRGPEDSAVPVWRLKHSCSLDVADLGGLNGPEMGDLLELTKERIRQIEVSALEHLRGYAGELGREVGKALVVYVPPPGPAVVVRTSTRRPPSSPPAPAGGIQLQLLDLQPGEVRPRRPARPRAVAMLGIQLVLWA